MNSEPRQAVQAQTGEPSPYGIGVSETLTHESNLDRDVSGAEKADWVSVTALNFSLDQPIGRQPLGYCRPDTPRTARDERLLALK